MDFDRERLWKSPLRPGAAVACLFTLSLLGCERGDIFEAASRGDTRGVTQLLQSDRGFAYVRDPVGRTPLHRAAEHGHSETIAFLIEMGVDPASLDRVGFSALDYARLSGSEEAVTLLEAKISLIEAILRNEEAIMERILAQDPEAVNRIGPDGIAPLHLSMDDPQTLEFLLNHGADPNVPFSDGESPLQRAVQDKDLRVIELLLSAGANPDSLDERGRSPLYDAIQTGNQEILGLLLNRGANPNLEMAEGLTPLQIAAQKGQSETIDKLLGSGATLEAKNEKGRDALYWARKHHHYSLAHFIAETLRIDDD
jgi:ankyrin repeat protein